MSGDDIFLSILFGSELLVLLGVSLGSKLFDESVGEYGNKITYYRILKIGCFLLFSILCFVLPFINLEIRATKIMSCLFGVISLGFCFYDIFVKNIRQEEYILYLQKQALISIAFEDFFDVVESKAKYDISENDKTMFFKLVQTENGYAFALNKAEGCALLKPKRTITKDEAEFLLQELNIYWTKNWEYPPTIQLFKDLSGYEYSKQFFWHNPLKIKWLFSKKTKKVLIKILVIIGVAIFLSIAVITILDVSFNLGIGNAISKWLFNE